MCCEMGCLSAYFWKHAARHSNVHDTRGIIASLPNERLKKCLNAASHGGTYGAIWSNGQTLTGKPTGEWLKKANASLVYAKCVFT